MDGTAEIGLISKQWSGILRELFTDADYFGVSFPMDLDVKMKAVLLGAVFLVVCIKYIIWNKGQNNCITKYKIIIMFIILYFK